MPVKSRLWCLGFLNSLGHLKCHIPSYRIRYPVGNCAIVGESGLGNHGISSRFDRCFHCFVVRFTHCVGSSPRQWGIIDTRGAHGRDTLKRCIHVKTTLAERHALNRFLRDGVGSDAQALFYDLLNHFLRGNPRRGDIRRTRFRSSGPHFVKPDQRRLNRFANQPSPTGPAHVVRCPLPLRTPSCPRTLYEGNHNDHRDRQEDEQDDQ